jgi:AraC-like DNA-binding protein
VASREHRWQVSYEEADRSAPGSRAGSGEDAAFVRGTYSTALGKAMLAFAVARGLPEATVLEMLQTTREALENPDLRLPARPAFDFWDHLLRTLDDPSVPIQVAEMLSPSSLGVVGFAGLTAASVREGLLCAARYYEILADTARLVLSDTRAGMRVEFVREGERTLALRAMNECSVAGLLRVLRLGSAIDFTPVRVSFRHAAPRDTTAHQRFFRTSVCFASSWDGLTIPSTVLDRVPSRADANMRSFFERHAEEQLRRLHSSKTLSDRIQASIMEELAEGEPTMAAVAKRLGTSSRTLRRQLKEERASFRDLVDAVRRRHAHQYLATTDATVTEIAYLLGFSEVSAFSRAFRRWYGKSARAYRMAHTRT